MASQHPERVDRVEMAVRLLRWLAAPDASAPYPTSSAFVDRARRHLVSGDPVPVVSRAFASIMSRAEAAREKENERFAERLSHWQASASEIGVEDVIPRVLAPLVTAAGRVLLVVLDGLSAAVSSELCEDLHASGWSRLAPQGGDVPVVLATLPSITEASRTSLLSGTLTRGDARIESKNFGSNAALREVCRADYPPQLFHRADLDAAWDNTVIARIETDRYKLVGVVVNAVDDHLAKDGQLSYAWKLETIRPLRGLLDAAARSGRVVVIASDHGHVFESGSRFETSDAGERWRPGRDAHEGERAFEGPRVLVEGGRVVLPWTEKLRYGPKKWGYHGGATPQEMVAPLVVLALPGQSVEGWTAVPAQVPEWWTQPALEVSQSPPVVRTSEPKRTSKSKKTVAPRDEQLALFAPPAVDGAVENPVLDSPLFRAQVDRVGLGADDVLRLGRMLGGATRSQGRFPLSPLGAALGLPDAELRDFLGRVERVLNFDGWSILSLTVDGETVRIDIGLARRVFLGDAADARRIRQTTTRGDEVTFTLPFAPSDSERLVLETLARYGRLSERDLVEKTKTRRVGGLMENLIEKLTQKGFTALAEESAGEDGRVFALRREKL